MAFLRLTRDRRGYENTFLLHADHPGEQPRVLYWYRTAPGVRVGRPPLDEDAIRTIEEQHPEIEFDWPHILEVGAITQHEEEERPIRQKRRPGRDQGSGVRDQIGIKDQAASRDQGGSKAQAGIRDQEAEPAPVIEDLSDEEPGDEEAEREAPPRAHDLLEELVGREIATRLHARYAEIIARVHHFPSDHPQRGAWEARAEALNPDNWVTPDEVLDGVQRADALFDSLRRELLAH